MIYDHDYDGNHLIAIIDLTDKGISVRQSFLLLALQARWIDYNIDEQKNKCSPQKSSFSISRLKDKLFFKI